MREGREKLNFSEQRANDISPEELIEEVEKGTMPMPNYIRMHPEANLSDAQKEALIAGFQASLHGTEEGEEREGGEVNEEREEGEANESREGPESGEEREYEENEAD